MRIKVSILVLASAMTAAAGVIPVPANAESPESASTLHVPFSFSVDGVILPAGDYVVDRDAQGSLIHLKNDHGGRSYSWMSHPARATDGHVILYFEARRQGYVLQSIQYGALVTLPLASRESMNGRTEKIVGH